MMALLVLFLVVVFAYEVRGGSALDLFRRCFPACDSGTWTEPADDTGTWYWMRSPEQEQRAVAAIYNRYCIRCHAIDGRGVWDMPDVPDFTNDRWQVTRSNGQLTRIILEGRGAVMPAFRGTLTLEQAWAMARYLRTFVPGSEVSRPDARNMENANHNSAAAPLKPKTLATTGDREHP
jgi:hypothetical protein